jgi:hypothetical protein
MDCALAAWTESARQKVARRSAGVFIGRDALSVVWFLDQRENSQCSISSLKTPPVREKSVDVDRSHWSLPRAPNAKNVNVFAVDEEECPIDSRAPCLEEHLPYVKFKVLLLVGFTECGGILPQTLDHAVVGV